MATYLIGDVQGCYQELLCLLEKISFNPSKDKLFFCGDLVNRGPNSLEVLRFVANLGPQHLTVLGNHDLHLLAVVTNNELVKAGDTLNDILTAPDREQLIQWLRHQPLAYYDQQYQVLLVHAGVAPEWDLAKTLMLAKEVEQVLKSDQWLNLFANMYGNKPDKWDESLTAYDRWRFIINCFTRIRVLKENGSLELRFKKNLTDLPEDLIPWFQFPDRATKNTTIVFGHWAALLGKTNCPKAIGLDTGCIWGNCLTALRLEDRKKISVKCRKPSSIF